MTGFSSITVPRRLVSVSSRSQGSQRAEERERARVSERKILRRGDMVSLTVTWLLSGQLDSSTVRQYLVQVLGQSGAD